MAANACKHRRLPTSTEHAMLGGGEVIGELSKEANGIADWDDGVRLAREDGGNSAAVDQPCKPIHAMQLFIAPKNVRIQ